MKARVRRRKACAIESETTVRPPLGVRLQARQQAQAPWARPNRTDKPRRRKRGARGPSWHVAVVLCLAAAGGCSRHANPTVLFDSATKLFRQGEYPAAKRKATLGYSEFQTEPGSEWFWKFRLLLADIDLRNGDTSEANRLLSKEPPAKYRGSFIQYWILRSYALYRAKKVLEADSELEAAAAQAHSIGEWELEADAEILLGSRLLPPTNWDRE